MKKDIKLLSEKVRKEKYMKKRLVIILIILLLLLLLLYISTKLIFNKGNYSITLDRNLYFERGLVVYDDPSDKTYRAEINLQGPTSFRNISESWLPSNLDDNDGGEHNGTNYLAYTFFVENIGSLIADYWSEFVLYDIVRNVDEALRIKLIYNGEATTYAKAKNNGNAENGTTPFQSDDLVFRRHVANFKPGSIDKYTLIIWIEGNDPDCLDDLIGGSFKFYMDLNSEFIDE